VAAGFMGGIAARLYRPLYRARFPSARSRQPAPFLGFASGDFSEAVSLQGLLMNAFRRYSHLLGELARFFQEAAAGRSGIRWWAGHASLHGAS
jgi:hypothetical protein